MTGLIKIIVEMTASLEWFLHLMHLPAKGHLESPAGGGVKKGYFPGASEEVQVC